MAMMCRLYLEIGNVSVGQTPLKRWTATDQRRNNKVYFSRISRHLSQASSDVCHELVGADTHGASCFQCHWQWWWHFAGDWRSTVCTHVKLLANVYNCKCEKVTCHCKEV